MKYKAKTIPIFLSIFILSISVSSLYAQNNQKSLTIKLYTNFLWDNTGELAETQFGYFSPALAINLPKGNFHEFELSRLQFNKTMGEIIIITDSIGNPIQRVYENVTKDIFVGFRYEYGIRFLKRKEEARLRPYLGLSVNPYYSYLRYDPMVSSSFPSTGHIFGADFSLIPRIKFFLNEKWFVDLNIPINLVGMSVQNVRVENPTLQENERTTSTVEFTEFPAIFQFRIGLGLTL